MSSNCPPEERILSRTVRRPVPLELAASGRAGFDLSTDAEWVSADASAVSDVCESGRRGERLLFRPCGGLLSGEGANAVAGEETMLPLVKNDGDGAEGVGGTGSVNWGVCPTNGASSEETCPLASAHKRKSAAKRSWLVDPGVPVAWGHPVLRADLRLRKQMPNAASRSATTPPIEPPTMAPRF